VSTWILRRHIPGTKFSNKHCIDSIQKKKLLHICSSNRKSFGIPKKAASKFLPHAASRLTKDEWMRLYICNSRRVLLSNLSVNHCPIFVRPIYFYCCNFSSRRRIVVTPHGRGHIIYRLKIKTEATLEHEHDRNIDEHRKKAIKTMSNLQSHLLINLHFLISRKSRV